jgi:hypothetical protein
MADGDVLKNLQLQNFHQQLVEGGVVMQHLYKIEIHYNFTKDAQ